MTTVPDWDQAERVPERGAVDRETFTDQVRGAGEPVVLRGQVSHWPLVRSGAKSPRGLRDELVQAATEQPVRYFEGPPSMGGRFSFTEDLAGFNFERREAPLADFLDRLLDEEASAERPYLYAGAVPLPEHLPSLLANHDHGLLEPDMEQLVSLWIGNRSRTAAHFDLPQNLACVVHGARRFILLPTSQLPRLYLGPLDRTLAGQATSLVDFLAPDFERHPRFRDALPHARVADLEPGDALYLPSLWFHHVESRDDFGVMMNFWWRDAPAHLFTPMITLMHALLSLKGLPERELAAWRIVFEHYIFEADGDPMAHLSPEARGLFGDMTPEKLRRLKYYLRKALG